jgi:hypothetical protein
MAGRSRRMRGGLLLAALGLALAAWLGQEEGARQAQALWSEGVARVQRCDREAKGGLPLAAVPPGGAGRQG